MHNPSPAASSTASPENPTPLRVTLVVARAHGGVIGVDNRLPWHLPEDLKHFRALTMGHAILMGRRTWESIGKALPGRRTIVVTRGHDSLPEGVERARSLSEALAIAATPGSDSSIRTDEAFVIGGARLFEDALRVAQRVVLTEIDLEVDGDTHFRDLDPARWREISRSEHRSVNGLRYEIVEYRSEKPTN